MTVVKNLILVNIKGYHARLMRNPTRTTLLINLSVEEAQQIRAAAKKQDRTISAYVLRAVMGRMRIEQQVQNRQGTFFERYAGKARGLRG